MINNWDHYAEITELNPDEETSESGTNFSFDHGTGDDSPSSVVLSDYPCKIKENVKYNTSEKGENYQGNAEMKGMLTDKIKEGMIVDGKFKIIGEPKVIHNRYLKCQLIRLS